MSVFEDQLKFEPLTPKRKILLKIEICTILWSATVLGLFLVYEVNKHAFDQSVQLFFEPVTSVVDALVQTWIHPLKHWIFLPLIDWLKHVDWSVFPHLSLPPGVVAFVAIIVKSLALIVETIAWPAAAFAFMAIFICYHSGILGRPRNTPYSFLFVHEARRWRVRLLEPRIPICLTAYSRWHSLNVFLLFGLSYVFLVALFSGLIASHCPIILPLFEPGVNYWFLASLRDANISFPQHWLNYSRDYQIAMQPYLSQSTHGVAVGWLPFYGMPSMPPDLQRFRLFVGALCGFVGAIPFTLTVVAAGLSEFAGRKINLTPTRLILTNRSFYFFSWSKTYNWIDLIRATLRNTSKRSQTKTVLEFEFTNNRFLKIDLEQLTTENKQLLIQALEELAPVCEANSELRSLMSKSGKDSSIGHTIFWDDELSKQRRSTVFVPLTHGETLKDGRLEILRQLSGQGWTATHLARVDGRLVVVRESLLCNDTDAGLRAFGILEKEAKILGALEYPGIAKVLDHFVENNRSYLLLEYIVGTDLRKKTILSGKLSEKTVIEIAERVCNILGYLHGRNPPVLHRDISPDNLVVTPNGDIRLIDFAASKQFIETATGTMIGKRSYMAPEQLRGKATEKSDLYSLGATMHYLLTGVDPLALSQCNPMQYRSDINSELNELIMSLTEFEQSTRPESIAAVRQRLAELKDQRGGVIQTMKEGLSAEYATIKLNRYQAEKS